MGVHSSPPPQSPLPEPPESFQYVQAGQSSANEAVVAEFLSHELPPLPSGEQTPLTLYHYCSVEVLIAIQMRGASLWMSDLRYMNDQGELAYASDFIAQIVREDHPNIPAEAVQALFPQMQSQHDAQAYCALSFSSLDDSLPQWRAYCRSNHGYALGFYFSQIEDHCRRFGMRLVRCIYDKGEQRTLLRPLVEQAIDHLVNGVALPHNWRNRYAFYAAVCKHPAFREESEWRVITPPIGFWSQALRFRPGQGAAVPYIHFPVTEDGYGMKPVDIVIGPTWNKAAAYGSVYLMTRACQTSSTMRHSRVPYRNITG
jgi:hypothetical protein